MRTSRLLRDSPVSPAALLIGLASRSGERDDRAMDYYRCTVVVFTQYLRNIEAWLDKAALYGKTKGFDPEVLVHARLAPDQYPLLRQVTAACDAAKWACAKLAGKQGPSHPDTETNLAELSARLRTVLAYLALFTPDDFVGAEDRRCQHVWMEGKSMRALDYVTTVALPNFYFHTTSVYQILRHNGVPLSKLDFLGPLNLS
jgi:hypothetical protein